MVDAKTNLEAFIALQDGVVELKNGSTLNLTDNTAVDTNVDDVADDDQASFSTFISYHMKMQEAEDLRDSKIKVLQSVRYGTHDLAVVAATTFTPGASKTELDVKNEILGRMSEYTQGSTTSEKRKELDVVKVALKNSNAKMGPLLRVLELQWKVHQML